MATLTLTCDEIVTLIKQSINLPSCIKKFESNKDRLKLTLDIGKFIPNFDIFLGFKSFSQGKLYLNINAKWPARFLAMKLLKSNIPKWLQKWCQINDQNVVLGVQWLEHMFKIIKIQNIAASGSQIIITILPKEENAKEYVK